MHPNRRWRTSQSRARSSRVHHASYPVFVHRPAALDWASSKPSLATTPLPFSLPSALRKPGHRTFTDEVTRHARRTRLSSAAARQGCPLERFVSDRYGVQGWIARVRYVSYPRRHRSFVLQLSRSRSSIDQSCAPRDCSWYESSSVDS